LREAIAADRRRPLLGAVCAGGTGAAAFAADRRRPLLGAVCAGGTGAAAFAAESVWARRDGDGWVLAGTARHVIDGDRADEVAVVAAAGGGLGVFVVPAGDAAATRTPTFDGSFHLADVAFDGVRVADDRAFTGPGVGSAVARARDEAACGLAAVMVGACRRVLDLAVAHVRDRRQFGVPIGSFQAVKHHLADVALALEFARPLVYRAAWSLAKRDADRSVHVSMAKARASDAALHAGRVALQVHGAIGYTTEYDLHLWLKRAWALAASWGDAAWHDELVGRAILDAHRSREEQ
jgi:alkylation response protein AidB-like acyl-CoA dehydrogenase